MTPFQIYHEIQEIFHLDFSSISNFYLKFNILIFIFFIIITHHVEFFTFLTHPHCIFFIYPPHPPKFTFQGYNTQHFSFFFINFSFHHIDSFILSSLSIKISPMTSYNLHHIFYNNPFQNTPFFQKFRSTLYHHPIYQKNMVHDILEILQHSHHFFITKSSFTSFFITIHQLNFL